MKKIYIFMCWFALSLFLLLEIGFVFVLPNVVNLNEYKAEIQKIAKEQGMINVDFDNAKIITTPLFGAGVQLDNLKISMLDDSELFSADKIKTRIALPSLFLLTVKVSCLEIDNPLINLEVTKDDFKLLTLVENIINSQKSTLLTENPQPKEELPLGIKMNWIRIKVPSLKINNYKILVSDLETGHYLNFVGEKLTAGYFNGKVAKLKTNAALYSDEERNMSFNLDINTSLPKIVTELDEEDDVAERIDIPFFNPVEAYRKNNLKADFDAKIKIRHSMSGGISSYGHFNVENISMNVGDIQLPVSYLRLKTFAKNLWVDTDLKIKENESISLIGRIKHGKNPNIDLNFITNQIYLQDLLDLAQEFLSSWNIYNELNDVVAGGYFKANTYVRTNFKKLKSNGQILLKDVSLDIKDLGKILADTNIDLSFEDNSLDIKESSLVLAGAKIFLNGGISDKSNVDVSINSESISLPMLYKAVAPKEIEKLINIFSGGLKFDVSLKGKMKNALLSANVFLSDLGLSDSTDFFRVNNGEFLGDFSISTKDIDINLKNKDFAISLPKSNSKILAKNAEVQIDKRNITIFENEINLNNKSIIKYRGGVENYPKLENIAFSADGSFATNDLVQFIGKEFEMFLHNKGVIPVSMSVAGDAKMQTLSAKVFADANNFITPVDFNELIGKETITQAVIDFKKNRIKVKDTGVFVKTVTYDKKGNEIISYKPIIDAEGTVVNTRINLLKAHVYDVLTGKIYAFPQSSFIVEEIKTFFFGQTYDPRFAGNILIEKLSIPELFLSMDKLLVQFKGQEALFNINNLLINESDLNIDGKMSLVLANIITLPSLVIKSELIDVDKLLDVLDAAMKYIPVSESAMEVATAPVDIPVAITAGDLNIQKIKTGNIKVNNVQSDISMVNNIFYLNDLGANIFDGKVFGDISMNLLSTLLNIDMKGTDIEMKTMLLDAAGMKDTLRGKTSFAADISLKGATFEEQIKTLHGDIAFLIKNGQFGPFGKLENLIIAENIRESEFFQNALGGVISRLTTIDSSHFQKMEGKISFEDGICSIKEITSEGKVIVLHIFGDFDVLKNAADMTVRAKMSSIVANLLGPISMINPINIMNSTAGLNIVMAKAFSLFCETLDEAEANMIPAFDNKYIDSSSLKFQLGVRGDVAKPLSLIKSFKWLVTPTEFQIAQDFVNSIPEPIEGSVATNIDELLAEVKALEEEKKTLKYKLLHIFDKKEK